MSAARRNDTGARLDVLPVGIPASDTVHRPYVLTSLVLASCVGFVLGIHIPLGRLLDAGSSERTADLVQAHGQVQLLGFAGLFVMGMSLRLMPRFAGSRVSFPSLVPVTLWLLAGSLALRAMVVPWTAGDLHSALLAAAVFGVLLAGACFLFLAAGTLSLEARRFDASSLALLLGALQLFLAGLVGAFALIEALGDGNRTLPYLANNAVLQLELSGFLISFVLGVAVRAIPTMVGIERPGRSAGLLAAVLAVAVALLGGSLLYLEYGSYDQALVLLADAAFLAVGLVLVGLAWQAGVLRQAANRIRPVSRPFLWLIRAAFVWLGVAAAIMIYAGGSGLVAGEIVTHFRFDAARHALGVGVITNLIAGMSLMILPEFAAERQRRNQQANLALALVLLINAAALLRVVPALAGTSLSLDDRNLLLALGGSLAEAAMLTFTVYVLRLFWRFRTSF